jgi:formylglycine-generating enzyme required for sulfatase activity
MRKTLLVEQVKDIYRKDPDAGLHAAAEWLLRSWQHDAWLKEVNKTWANDKPHQAERWDDILKTLRKGKKKTPPQWYVTSQGHTMVVIPGPVDFKMGSPPTEAGRRATEPRAFGTRVNRTYAIASKEVTVAQYRKFHKAFFGRDYEAYSKEYSPTADCPANRVSWYKAAAYCNWLSEQEGIPREQWCYEPDPTKGFKPDPTKGFKPGMTMKVNYLHLTGYRLPTEAEWECACRAGAWTSRFYGEAEELLGNYAWYTKNSLDRWMLPGGPGRPAGSVRCMKPNDFGLFDMLGNALEWCHDRVRSVPRDDEEDNNDLNGIIDEDRRVLRGGTFNSQPRFVRCADRQLAYEPRTVDGRIGFRPARTITAE